MSYLRYLCLLAHSGVQHILCCVFVLFVFRLVYPMLSVSLDCVVFLFCLSSSCVPYVVSFSGLCCVFVLFVFRLVYPMLSVSLDCVVFLYCLSSSCVPYVVSFSGLCCVFVLFVFVLCTLCCQFLWIVLLIAPYRIL